VKFVSPRQRSAGQGGGTYRIEGVRASARGPVAFARRRGL
jgi:hypothetical protein